jgi:hypothetical protein
MLECVTTIIITTFDEMCPSMMCLLPDAVREAAVTPVTSHDTVSGNRENKPHGGTN